MECLFDGANLFIIDYILNWILALLDELGLSLLPDLSHDLLLGLLQSEREQLFVGLNLLSLEGVENLGFLDLVTHFRESLGL